VRDAAASTGGLYEVDLRTVAGTRPAFCTAAGQLSLGGSVTGNITYTGCQYTDQTFADLYQFTVAADTTVQLDLSSGDFDAYLVLLDAKGNVVDDDDDSGGNTNARITAPLPAGTYYVVAKPFSGYLSHGAYTLTAKPQ
jgi:serine protease Do